MQSHSYREDIIVALARGGSYLLHSIIFASTMLGRVLVVLCMAAATNAFMGATRMVRSSTLMMSDGGNVNPNKFGGIKADLPKDDGAKKMGNFNYDPSNYKDSNSGNYRRLSDQLAARKDEDEKLARERDELVRKEQMAAMILRKENETFWSTKDDLIVATTEKYFLSPAVMQVIDDLDNQLIGLKPVKEKMRRYAAQMLSHKIRE